MKLITIDLITDVLFSNALFIIFGWLLGLLSPIIVDAVRDRHKISDVKKIIKSELQELQYRLLFNIFLVDKNYSNLDRTFFEWAQSILIEYKGINSKDALLKATGQLLKLTNDEVNYIVQQLDKKDKPNRALLFRKHFLYSIEINLPLIAKLNSIFLGRLLEIKTRIGFINEISEESDYYFKLSFQNDISSGNYKIATDNMINSYKNYTYQAKETIEIIREVLSELK